MSQCKITIEVLSIQPQNINIDWLSICFRSDCRDFDQELNYGSKTPIVNKTKYRKEIKYNIKLLSKGSLIGISEFCIPSSILSKRIETYSNLCNVTMTDNVKRSLLGNLSTSLKIEISVNIKYMESHTLKQSYSLPKKKFPISPKMQGPKNKYIDDVGSVNNHLGVRNLKTPSSLNSILQAEQELSKEKSNKCNKLKRSVSQQKNLNYNSKIDLIEKKEEEEEFKDNSFINDILLNDIIPVDEKFKEYINEYINNNPLSSLKEIQNINELQNKTKNTMEKFFDYQSEYYQYLSHARNLNNQLREQLIKNNEKLRQYNKKKDKLNAKKAAYDIKQDLISNFNKRNNIYIGDIVGMKKKEIDIYKKGFNIYYKEAEYKKFADSLKKETNDNKNLLLRIVNGVIDKFGSLDKLITTENSKEEELESVQEIIKKFNLPNGEIKQIIGENEEKYDVKEEQKEIEEQQEISQEKSKDNENYIIMNSPPDPNDKKLNEYLNYFYTKRKIPKIMFKKISANNYEYGSQKVMVKIEGSTIRVRSVAGYSIIDKFLDLNAPIEERKIKQKRSSSSGSSNQKQKRK